MVRGAQHSRRRPGWLGEIEGIDLTLSFLRQKREETRRFARIAPVDLGIPALPRLAARNPRCHPATPCSWPRQDGEIMTAGRLLGGDHLALVNQPREQAEDRELLQSGLLIPLLVLVRCRVPYERDAGQAKLLRPPLAALDRLA